MFTKNLMTLALLTFLNLNQMHGESDEPKSFCLYQSEENSLFNPIYQAATYKKPLQVEDQTWRLIEPFLLPDNHEAKAFLDKHFSQQHLLTNFETLQRAGFKCHKHSRADNLTVAKHMGLKGYLLKVFTDDQPQIDELENFLRRIYGAEITRQIISQKGYQKFMKVPKKWIYPLPETLSDSVNPPKRFILVVEDMRILKTRDNYKKWKSSRLSRSLLEIVYNVVESVGLKDSLYIDNIPFCKDGKIAVIDTEHYYSWPVRYETLLDFLGKKQKEMWLEITKH